MFQAEKEPQANMEVRRKIGPGRKKTNVQSLGGHMPAVVKQWQVDSGSGIWGHACFCSSTFTDEEPKAH